MSFYCGQCKAMVVHCAHPAPLMTTTSGTSSDALIGISLHALRALEQERDAVTAALNNARADSNGPEGQGKRQELSLVQRVNALAQERDMLRTRLEAAVKVVGAVRRHAHSSDCGCDLCDALAEYDRLKK